MNDAAAELLRLFRDHGGVDIVVVLGRRRAPPPHRHTAGVREAFTVGGKTGAAALMVLIASLRALLPLGVDLTSAKLPMREVPARSEQVGHRAIG
ncbi:hypothetical protein [Streptomyces lateritius]|uniref:hypothetical protein n=1 Tax=Streptomyces lateritius TaxID=67313 RepID=UPI001C8B74D2|nr:hypothetical protein [Streptomyces lateritius]MBX9427664.1 hypothetical protein [Streptomyces lateritius]